MYLSNQPGQCNVKVNEVIELEQGGYIVHIRRHWSNEQFMCHLVIEHLGPYWDTNHLVMRDLAGRVPPGAQAIIEDGEQYAAQVCSQQSFTQKVTGHIKNVWRYSASLFS